MASDFIAAWCLVKTGVQCTLVPSGLPLVGSHVLPSHEALGNHSFVGTKQRPTVAGNCAAVPRRQTALQPTLRQQPSLLAPVLHPQSHIICCLCIDVKSGMQGETGDS